MIKPIQITVGAGGFNPEAGDTEYNNTDLAGLDGIVSRSGYGIFTYQDYEVLVTGGFRLLNGYDFAPDEVWFFTPTAFSATNTSATYTNGFHYNKVMAAMMGRLAWRQPTETEYAVLDTANTTSKSARYFDDFHSVCNAAYLKQIIKDPGLGTVSYNAYLQSLQKSVIMEALTSVFSETEYLCQKLLYRRCSYNDAAVGNENNFVGIKIKAPNRIGLATQLETLYLYFDRAITFNVYVFNDAIKAPIKTIPVTTVAGSQTPVAVTDCVLSHISDTNATGDFYIGYFQADIEALGAKAIREYDVNISNDTPFGFSFFSATKTASLEFNRGQISETWTPSGLNALVSVWRDHTWQIINKAPLFDNLVGLKTAAKVVEMIIYSTRSNSDERKLKDSVDATSLYQDLNGAAVITDGPRTEGLVQRVAKEIPKVKHGFFHKTKAQTVNLC